jgi:TatD DNase family protein
MPLVDTHVHINFETFQSDLEAIRDRWRQAGVVYLVHSCVEPTEVRPFEPWLTSFLKSSML